MIFISIFLQPQYTGLLPVEPRYKGEDWPNSEVEKPQFHPQQLEATEQKYHHQIIFLHGLVSGKIIKPYKPYINHVKTLYKPYKSYRNHI